MASKKNETERRLGTAPTSWRKLDTAGIGGGGTPWDFAVFPECVGILKKVQKKSVKGFDGGERRMKVLADVDVENVSTGAVERYTLFLPDGYERVLNHRLLERWIKVERIGEGFATRFEIETGG